MEGAPEACGKDRTFGIGKRATLWVVCSIVTISATACSHDGSIRVPRSAVEAVTLVLMPARPGSDVCCRVVTDNPGKQALNVVCHLIVSNLEGRVVYAGLVPGPPPGHRRSSGFLAPPGRHAQGLFDLPVDLDRVRYRAICPVAAWHGAPPI